MPGTALPPHRDLLNAIRAVVGERGLLTNPADTIGYTEDWRHLYRGSTPAVIRPANTEELAAVVRLCAAAHAPIVPQGGNTSMVGGATPSDDGSEFVLSLSRMTRIRDIDPVDMTLTIEAGVTLKAAQNCAADSGCLLPLSISSEGTAQIGGVLAANAGGNNTLRYGNARDLVLGLEVVLADGSVWNGLRRLRKDNTGYCLRQLFVGSEGTLGIITAAVLKLVPRPRETCVAFCAVGSPDAALELFSRFQAHDQAAVQAFEYMSGEGVAFVLRHVPGAALPLARPARHYVLVELATPRPEAGLRASMEAVLVQALAEDVVLDAAIAESDAQSMANLAVARGTLRGAEARGRQREERRFGARVESAGIHPPRHRRVRGADPGHPRRSVRPHGRRQYPLQSGAARRRRSYVVPRAGSRDHGCGERGGACARRQLLGGARHRQAEAIHDAGLARRPRVGGDAADQGRARPAGDHESGQGAAVAQSSVSGGGSSTPW